MVELAPERATISLTCDGTTVQGVMDAAITRKKSMVDLTCVDDDAVRRFPGIKDPDCKLTIARDPADAGQVKIDASYEATPGTLLQYVLVKGTKTYTFNAYVEQIGDAKGPKDAEVYDVVLAVSGGVAVT